MCIKNPTEFNAGTDLCVIGHNSEMADVTNPRGEIFGHRAYVRAQNAFGDTAMLYLKVGRWESEVLPPAERMAVALNERLKLGKLPVAFERWEPGRAVYGSDAYVAYGQAEDVALERNEEQE